MSMSCNGIRWRPLCLLAAAALTTSAFLAVAAPAASAETDTTAPPTAQQFYINGVTATSVSMQWGPGYITEPTGWRLYRNGVLQVPSTGSSGYWDRNLVPGATYSYYVVSFDKAGNTSAPTRTLTVTTRGPGVVPSGPANLRATEVSAGRVTLEFDRPHDEFDVGQFTVYDGTTAIGGTYPAPFAGATTTAQIRHLVPGSSHSYSVRALRPAPYALSPPSNTLQVTTPTTNDAQAPTTPTGLVVRESRYACDFVDLTWAPSTDNADPQAAIDYEYYVNGTFRGYVRGIGKVQNVQLLSHGAHTLTVRAVDSADNGSAQSAAATFTVSSFCQLES
jgi:chitodextrinase